MSIINLFDVNLEGNVNLRLADRLSLLTIVVPADVAEKQQRLKSAGFESPNMEGLEQEVTLLTNYLIHKSFISTIRSLIKAMQLADRLKSVQRDEQRNQLISIVNDFLRNLYSFRIVSQDGITIDDNGDAVLSLFSKIVEEVFDATQGMADDKLQEFLAKKQHEYVRLILDRARRLTSTIETISSNQATNEKIESLLNRMETANLEWLIETYSLHIDATTGRKKLPELDNETQTKISNAVLLKMRNKVAEFHEATQKGMTRNKMRDALQNWLPFGKRKALDLSQTNLLETEQFIVELRLHVSYRQQITILGSILDKVNEFASFLAGFEAVVSSATRKAHADVSQAKLDEQGIKNDKLRNSGDPVNVALAEMSGAAQRPLQAETELQKMLSSQDEELAKKIFGLKEYFTQKAATANLVLAKLTEIGNMVRVMGPMVIGEARQKDAQFTARLIIVVTEGTKEILETEGAASNSYVVE